jgi:hypothetical protein
MQKNWIAIAGITEPLTRVALIMPRNPSVLEQLQQRFPECFMEGEQNGAVPDSLSDDVARVMPQRPGEHPEAYARRIAQYFAPLEGERQIEAAAVAA